MVREKEALAEAKKAQELDPLSLPIITSLGEHYFLVREYDNSIDYCKKAIEMDANFPWAHSVLGNAYIQKSQFNEAIREKQIAISVSGDSIEYICELAYAYGFAGKTKEALKILDELLDRARHEYVSLSMIALIHISLKENDEALTYLEKALEKQDMSYVMLTIKVNPMFDSLRSNIRFTALLKRLGLEN